MTRKSTTRPTSRAAQFVSKRIYELQSRKTQADIADEAGFGSPEMLSMIKADKAKLPVERAVKLAQALECDPALLVRLALEQSLTQPLIDQIFNTSPGAVTHNEQKILERIRALSANSDPGLTSRLEAALTSYLVPTAQQAPASFQATVVALLGVEVRAAQRELGNAKQFITHAMKRAERVDVRLETIATELSEMIADLRK
ncbi:MAG: helix-turn-helix transcriptional regulator [Devosia sp.]